MIDLELLKWSGDRLKFLRQNVPPCPKCSEKHQIQLREWINEIAEWKCRTCKYKFNFEPQVEKH